MTDTMASQNIVLSSWDTLSGALEAARQGIFCIPAPLANCINFRQNDLMGFSFCLMENESHFFHFRGIVAQY
jgi:hypothetical protein